jgi:hypothetical protein
LLRNILLENCTVDKIQPNAFSGFLMNNITLRGLSINRLERSAFSDQSAIDSLHIDRCNIREEGDSHHLENSLFNQNG